MAGKSKSVVYRRASSVSLKTAGILNIEDDGNIIIGTDDGDKKLSTLLSNFQGAAVELSVGFKDVEDLPDPTEED